MTMHSDRRGSRRFVRFERVTLSAFLAACGAPHAAPDAAHDSSSAPCTSGGETFLKPSNAGAGFDFGFSVAMSSDGNTVAVGAQSEPSASRGINGVQTDDSAPRAGAVYVFARVAGTWTQQAYIKASNTEAQQFFGASVALSGDGNTLAVGAPGEASAATGIDGNQTDTSAPDAGAVYIFERSSNQWAQQAYVKASNTKTDDQFGSLSLSGDGDTLAVLSDSAAYIFAATGGVWAQQTYFVTNIVDGLGFLSASLSNDGNTLAVGDPGNVHASVFSRSGIAWGSQTAINSPNPNALDFGGDVSLSADGTVLAIADPTDSEDGANSGAVFVYRLLGATWTLSTTLRVALAQESLGSRLAISADSTTLAAAATENASDAQGVNGDEQDTSAPRSGAIYLFTAAGATWSQTGYLKASNSIANDYFGGSVSLTADGSVVLAGAPNEPSDASGVDGDQCDQTSPERGAAYLISP